MHTTNVDGDSLATPPVSSAGSAPSAAGKLPISVFIIAKNEADRIAKTIRPVIDWVDEVIVVDSGSTDETVEISRALGARTVFNAWQGYGPQKRYAESLCRNDWVLNLDADEVLTPALVAEIQALFRNGTPPLKAYAIRMTMVFPFEKRPNFAAASTTYIRLYDKRIGQYKDSTVHDTVKLAEGVKYGKLKAPAWHRSLRSHRHTVEKINSYTSMQAEDMFRKGRKFSLFRVIATFPWSFFKAYFLRGFIFYGAEGISQAYIYAFSRFLRAAKLYERIHYPEGEG